MESSRARPDPLLVNAAGGHGIVVNPGESVSVHVLGYP